MLSNKNEPGKLRTDFPLRRLLAKLVLGNAIVIGSANLIWTGLYFTSLLTYYGITPQLVPRMASRNQEFVETILLDGLYLSIALMIGTFFSMVWYIVARQIETRRMHKKWLVIQKTRGETPPP